MTEYRTFQFSVAAANVLPEPTAGRALLVGTNTVLTATNRPTGVAGVTVLNDSQWAYSKLFSYGGGAFVPTYGTHGAYVIAASGGHTSPDSIDTLLFDFSDDTWKCVRNTNGVSPFGAGGTKNAYVAAQTTGTPHYEINNEVGITGNPPAPGHAYRSSQAHPTSAIALQICGSAVAGESLSRSSVHQVDLATGYWTRLATVGSPSVGVSTEHTVEWDATNQRFWYVRNNPNASSVVAYLDWADKTWKSASFGSTPVESRPHVIVDGAADYILMIDSKAGSTYARVGTISNPALGWAAITYTGSLPSGWGYGTRWHKYTDGSWYTFRGHLSESDQSYTPNVLHKITAPANPRTGTWQFSTVNVAGDTMPNDVGLVGAPTVHYSRFCYVPSRNSFAWLSGPTAQVALVKP